ncbi:MAG: radical SAM protein [Chitinispirillaceae bacterium]|nr:radical SAM protein [Chitinispirillaceae bacterium]
MINRKKLRSLPDLLNKRLLLIFGNPPLGIAEIENSGIPISPGIRNLLNRDAYVTHATQPGLGAVSLATYMNRAGYKAVVKDWYLDSVPIEEFQIIGISTTALDLNNLADITKKIRIKNPDCLLIGGGPLSWSYSPEEIFTEIQEIDFFVNNEGEITFIDLLVALEKGYDLTGVSGISFRMGDSVHTTPTRTALNPKNISLPDWSLVDFNNRIPLLPFETMRGCPYQCAFCSEVTYWGKPVRFRAVSDILSEVEHDIERFGITTFRISDSCFSAPENRCLEVCSGLTERFINNGVKIQWSAFSRITNLQPFLIEKMKGAGCVALDIGMESGDTAILKGMKKNYESKDIIERVTMVHEAGIIAHCNVVVGFPGETRTSIQNTIDTLNASRPDTYHCMLLYVAPNTDLSIHRNHYSLVGDKLHWNHATMSSDQASEAMNEIVQSVKNSCLFISGEISSIMLIASGFTQNDVRSFFSNIADNKIGDAERAMSEKALLRKVLPVRE